MKALCITIPLLTKYKLKQGGKYTSKVNNSKLINN